MHKIFWCNTLFLGRITYLSIYLQGFLETLQPPAEAAVFGAKSWGVLCIELVFLGLWLFWQMIFGNVFHLCVSNSAWGANQGCQLAARRTKAWILREVTTQLEDLGRKLGGFDTSFIPPVFKRKKENKYHITDTINHFLQTELFSAACQFCLQLGCFAVGSSTHTVAWPGIWMAAWCPGTHQVLLCSEGQELAMSLPSVTTSACERAWELTCLHVYSTCQDRKKPSQTWKVVA